jgi:hypothetical protein
MTNTKLMEDITIHKHIPRMIIVIDDLCKKRKQYAEKNKEQRCLVVGWREKALGWT